MCRSIKTLRDAEPPTDTDDVRAAALQFVRKVSGYRQPSRRNAAAFDAAVDAVAATTQELLEALGSPPLSGPSPAPAPADKSPVGARSG